MPIINPDASQAPGRMLQIESRQLLPNVLPTLAIGDIIPVTVRQNPPDGAGLIYFKGLLVKAALPKNVEPGDKLLAKLTESNNNVVLKILQHEHPAKIAGLETVAPEFVADLENLMEQGGPQGFRSLRPFQLNETLQKVANFEQSLAKITKALATPEVLTNPTEAMEQLMSAADGSLAENLREVAKEIRTFIDQNRPPEAKKTLDALQKQLVKIIDDSSLNNEVAAQDILDLADSLADDIFRPEQQRPDRARLPLLNIERDTVKALTDRVRGVVKFADANPNDPLAKTEANTALAQVQTLLKAVEAHQKLDPKSLADLTQIASRFEQMASSQESLAKMNPVMQALGEPALILFPFLMQGLISHSEVTIETKKRVDEEEEGGGKGGNREPFQRVQVAVPLPSLGTIDVDIAHRTQEIWVRFTVSDPEVGKFLLEKLERLAPILREYGFKKAELVAHVGQKQENLPAWSFGLHSSTSIFA